MMNGWMDGWMDGGMDGWRDGWEDGWMDGGMDGWISLNAFLSSAVTCVVPYLTSCTKLQWQQKQRNQSA